MKKRQEIKTRNGTGYVNKDLRKKCQQAKYECLNKKCSEIETLQNMDIAGMYETIKEIAG